MTDDLAALLDHLKTGPVDVLGWSDGGIEALLLGIRHPAKVKKIVAMAVNLNPSDKAVRPDILDLIRQSLAAVPAADRDTPRGQREGSSCRRASRPYLVQTRSSPTGGDDLSEPPRVLPQQSTASQRGIVMRFSVHVRPDSNTRTSRNAQSS